MRRSRARSGPTATAALPATRRRRRRVRHRALPRSQGNPHGQSACSDLQPPYPLAIGTRSHFPESVGRRQSSLRLAIHRSSSAQPAMAVSSSATPCPTVLRHLVRLERRHPTRQEAEVAQLRRTGREVADTSKPAHHWVCQARLAPPCSPDLAPPLRTRVRVVRSRKLSVPVSMMCALKVTRSTMAATRRGSGITWPHSLNGRLLATAIDAFSSRSVTTWNKSSEPLASSCT